MTELTLQPGMVAIEFRCNLCGFAATLQIRGRRPGEELKPWMDEILEAVAFAHRTARPQCTSGTADIKIPLPAGQGPLGSPTEH